MFKFARRRVRQSVPVSLALLALAGSVAACGGGSKATVSPPPAHTSPTSGTNAPTTAPKHTQPAAKSDADAVAQVQDAILRRHNAVCTSDLQQERLAVLPGSPTYTLDVGNFGSSTGCASTPNFGQYRPKNAHFTDSTHITASYDIVNEDTGKVLANVSATLVRVTDPDERWLWQYTSLSSSIV